MPSHNDLAVLSGGSGSSKFALAFTRYADSVRDGARISFVANVSDNFWHNSLLICPDVDILTYALSGELDESKGWGLLEDGFSSLTRLSVFDSDGTWFKLGDMDLALSIRRTQLLARGWKLSSITEDFSRNLRIRHEIIPATDDHLETYFKTNCGLMHLQEYWVRHKALPGVFDVIYEGLNSARPHSKLLGLLTRTVIICPANPVTSIMPTIRLPGVKGRLSSSKIIAISPFVGNKPFSGPAGAMMSSLGLSANSFGVAKLYSSFLKILVLDSKEEIQVISKIKDLGIECIQMNTRLSHIHDQLSFAEELFGIV